jgi:hypothetical protein
MINWMRPSGTPISTNEMEVTIAYAEKLGWKRIEDKEAPPKRKRRTKAEMIADGYGGNSK